MRQITAELVLENLNPQSDMKDILQRITDSKRQDVLFQKEEVPVSILEKAALFERPCLSMSESLLNPEKSSIIAEFKRYSPSKKDINTHSTVAEVTAAYNEAGASGLSILTNLQYFKGNTEDVFQARYANAHADIPILRKEFIVDEYQILEAKAIGADCILLIAECLTANEVASFAKFARSLGLEVLLEVHTQDQLIKITDDINIVGVNNRNLKTFEVDLENSIRILEHIPTHVVRISESGISNVDTIIKLQKAGFQGFLIGECFMKEQNPGASAKVFMEELSRSLRSL